MKRKLLLPVFAVLSVVAVGSVFAARMMENDAIAIETAKVDLTQAVLAAEQQVGGKASRAEYENHNGQWVFDVEVVKGKDVMDVTVDPNSGKVIASAADKDDRDGEHEKAD